MSISFFLDTAQTGIANMSRDKHLFERVDQGDKTIYLRLYTWLKPTYTYGYRQNATELNLDKSWESVQRITGGGVVLHQPGELTYCLVCPKELFPENIMSSSLKISEIFLPVLIGLGIPAEIAGRKGTERCDDPDCFARPATYEILANGQKILGSAQKRGKLALLQHGTFQLPIKIDYKDLALQLKQEFISQIGCGSSN